MRVDEAADERLAEDDDEPADADADVGEPRGARLPAADFSEDDGVGDEAEVEDGVDDGDVEVPEDAVDYGLVKSGSKKYATTSFRLGRR